MTSIDHNAGNDRRATALLGFASGDRHWLVDLADAGEVLPVPDLCEVPLTKHWFRGIANIRGTFYSVTDLAAFLGGAPTPIGSQSRLLLSGAGLRQRQESAATSAPISHMALLMARTFGMKPLATLQMDESAPNHERPWCGSRYRDVDGQSWACLDLSELMTATEFLDIAA